jgi:hypothetical protein
MMRLPLLFLIFLVLISIPMSLAPSSTQASQPKQCKMKQPLKRSGLKLIDNIKKACVALSIDSSTLAEAASELGIPKQEISFERVVKEKIHDLGVSYGEYYVKSYTDNPEKITVDLLFKDSIFQAESLIPIEVLEEGFGAYTVGLTQGDLTFANFNCGTPESKPNTFDINVTYNSYTEKIMSVSVESIHFK